MSFTQFAMVEELASLVKDNIPSRHLVLAVEEALVNYLKDDPSPHGILELEPMSSYNRLILHRLADIFGFAHESVGEGDDRHLVLQQCLETSIPPILVSDILWQQDSCESQPVPYQLLRRDESSSLLQINVPASPNFLEREAAYMAARERIFGVDEVESKEVSRSKPRVVPAVARRMIAHALGKRITQGNKVNGDNSAEVHDVERRFKVDLDLNCETHVSDEVIDANGVSSTYDTISCVDGPGSDLKDGTHISTRMREENMGAAKRIFAHALGIQASKDVSRCRKLKGFDGVKL